MVSKKKSKTKSKSELNTKSRKNSGQDFSQISYVLGIIGLVFSFISPLAGIVIGIIGLNYSNKQKTNLSDTAKKLSIAAIIVGMILLAILLILEASIGLSQI